MYIACNKNKINCVAELAFSKAKELGFEEIQITDLMEGMSIIGIESFGFKRFAF